MISVFGWLLTNSDNGYTERILKTLGQELKASIKSIDEAKKSDNEDYLDAITDDECGMIEDLIGAALVVAQVYINAVVSNIKKVHKIAKKKSPDQELGITSGKKDQILKFGSDKVKVFDFTEVELIDAGANYFKHKGEPRLNEDMSKILRSVGCMAPCIGSDGASTGNLRYVMEALGVEYAELDRLSEILISWCSKLYATYKASDLISGNNSRVLSGT